MINKLKKEIEELINKYLKEEKKTCLNIKNEWKSEELKNKKTHLGITYPRIYSNQYFAFMELKSFWEKLKQKLNGEQKQ